MSPFQKVGSYSMFNKVGSRYDTTFAFLRCIKLWGLGFFPPRFFLPGTRSERLVFLSSIFSSLFMFLKNRCLLFHIVNQSIDHTVVLYIYLTKINTVMKSSQQARALFIEIHYLLLTFSIIEMFNTCEVKNNVVSFCANQPRGALTSRHGQNMWLGIINPLHPETRKYVSIDCLDWTRIGQGCLCGKFLSLLKADVD